MVDYLVPHFARAALLVIDVQHDFVDGAMPVPGTAEVLPALASLVEGFRGAGLPVVHVIRLYRPGGSDVDLVRRAQIEGGAEIVAPGARGAEIPASLLPGRRSVGLDADSLLHGGAQRLSDDEAIVFKPRWSAFHRTSLGEWLGSRGVDTVVVAGCNLPNCPRATLIDASERDYRTVLVTDAVSGTTQERLDDLELIGVNLLTTGQTLMALGELPAP